MKIGIDISQAVYKGTGVANYTRSLVAHLLKTDTKSSYVLFGSSMRKRGVLQSFVDSLPRQSSIEKKFFPFPPLFLDNLWNKMHILPIERFIEDIDIFHSSDWTQPPSVAKKITTIHDLVVFRYPQHLPKKIVYTHKRRLSWVAKECDAVIADSKSTKEDIVKYLKLDSKKIHVVYLGVDSIFSPQNHTKISTVKKKYAIAKDYILSVGTLEPRKNIQIVIEAFQKIQKDLNCNLVIVGNIGWGKSIPKVSGVKNVGFVSISDLPALYSGASCFVYPSLYEGFGLPVLEAMACGCPVVCSDRGSLKEIAGSAAIIVNPSDVDDIAKKIKSVVSLSDDQYAKQVEKGFKHAQNFTWEKTAKETLKVYKEVLR